MAKYRDLDRGDVLPASWTDAIQEFVSTLSSNVKIEEASASSIRIPADVDSAQVSIGIDGLWRYRTTDATASVTGSAGTYDIFVTATANDFSNSPSPDTDNTDYDFGLEVLEPPDEPSGGGIVAFRKMGELEWSGTAITEIRQLLGDGGFTEHAQFHNPGGTDELDWDAIVDELDIAAADLSNGTTGTGAVVLAGGPTLTGTTTVATLAATTLSGTPNFSGAATGQTAAVDTNTTQLATTAYVVGQGYLKSATAAATYAPLASPTFTGTPAAPTAAVDTSTTQVATTAFVTNQASGADPLMNGSVAQGTSKRYSRQDHVHPVDTSRAPLASPTLTGTPAAPTAAVDTNTTQLATTAYVVGQGYLKAATAASTYAPIASPTFTGTATIPTAAVTTFSGTPNFSGNATAQTQAVDNDTTRIATTAYVIAQGYLKSATAATTYAPLASPALTGNPTAPTQTPGNDSTRIATTAFVAEAVATGGGSFQPLDSDLTSIAALATAAFGRGLLTETSAANARTTLGVPATSHTHAQADITNLTSDLALKAPLASPTFTGTPAAPTAAADTNTTQVATTAYVVGQGYLKSATAASTYAPLASPTFTGQVEIPLGTVGAPGIGFSGDDDTGIYQAASSAGTLSITTNGAIAATFHPSGHLNILGEYRIGGTALAASHLSNGTTGTGSVALAAGPTFTGTPAAPTAAADTNTTQIATTAYVIGQGYLKSATAATTYAPLASPALTGNPTAPTASPGDNDTSIATTAFVTAADTAAVANRARIDASNTWADGVHFVLGTTSGSKIGTGATQKLGFWNATPVVQSTGWSATNHTSLKSLDYNTFTLNQLARAFMTLVEQLKTYGLLGA